MNTILTYLRFAWAWILAHPLHVLVAIILIFLLICLLIIPLWRRYKLHREKKKETAQLKQDLMVWDNLNKLARGGEDASEVKESMSSRKELIRHLFKNGLSMLKDLNRKGSDIPWFVMVGEPASGKSSILKYSRLDMRFTMNEQLEYDAKRSVPINFCATPKGLFLDVSGRVFFDRWMNGSGAEWNLIAKLIRKKNSHFPLDGIILTIPADALLSDTESLTAKKASLIASELTQLLQVTGMVLPCYVVITKCDMLPGFREYFNLNDEQFSKQIFGWTNPAPDTYKPEEYSSFIDKTYDSMLASRSRRMFAHQMKEENGTACGNFASAVYSFPEEFVSIQNSIQTYLKSIFGTGNLHASLKAGLVGVFFTSAEDSGVCLDRACAAACNKPVDETLVCSHRLPDRGSAFVTSLLENLVCSGNYKGRFTSWALIHRHIPLYLLTLILCFCGFILGSAALVQRKSLKQTFTPLKNYYSSLIGVMRNKSTEHSPLIVKRNGQWAFALDDPFDNNKQLTRGDFYQRELDVINEKVNLPIGFRLSSKFLFNQFNNPGYPQKATIHNQILMDMLERPLVVAVLEKLQQKPANEPFTLLEAKICFSTLKSTAMQHQQFKLNFKPFQSAFEYIFPDAPPVIIDYFSTWQNNTILRKNLSDLMYSVPMLGTFLQKSLLRFMSQWETLNVYPSLNFAKLRQLSVYTEQFKATAKALDVQKFPPQNASYQELVLWYNTREENVERLKTYAKLIRSVSLQLGILPNSQMDKVEHRTNRLIYEQKVTEAYQEWIQRLKEDSQELLSYASEKEARMEFAGQLSSENIQAWYQKCLEASRNAKEDLLSHYRIVHFLLKAEETTNQLGVSNSLIRLVEFPLQAARVNTQDGASLETQWNLNEKRLKNLNQELQLFTAQLLKDGTVPASIIASTQNTMNDAANISRAQILFDAAKRLPQRHSDVIAKISASKTSTFDTALLREQMEIGDVRFTEEFNPAAAQALFQNVATLFRLCSLQQPTDNSTVVRQKAPTAYPIPPELGAIRYAFRDYITSYLNYWIFFLPKPDANIKTYADFHRRISNLKVYRTNENLREVYSVACNALSQIPDELLTQAEMQRRAKHIAALTTLIGSMKGDFSAQCMIAVSHWSALSADPLEAWRQIVTMTASEFTMKYMSVVPVKDNPDDISWWTAFLNRGKYLVLDNTRTAFITKYSDFSQLATRFPLAPPSPKKLSLSNKEFTKIYTYITEYMPPVKNKSGEQVITVAFDNILTDWGKQLRNLTYALGAEKTPECSLFILSAKEQEKWCQKLIPYLPLARLRFRYLTVVSSQSKTSATLPSFGENEPITVCTRPVSDDVMELRFSEFSGGKGETVSVTFDNGWAPLQLMFQKEVFYDEKNSIAYVPLVLKGKSDVPFVYCIGVRYDKSLPSPKKWPNETEAFCKF